ncbi:MAG: CoA transferase [Paracoccaceae bacterium]|nr:CoA transferase [Paracoccaceae bacterium]
MTGALDGLVVLDLTRILAGPTCTQLLGDLGAEVIKIENPGSGGDDTRVWGPPYAVGTDGLPTDLSAYFMAANRNKLSVAVDIATPQGQDIIRALAARADVVIENFKPGGLAKYGLDHASLLAVHPRLIYCSISGYGQTGPNAAKPGYDMMAQGYGGIMSLTGEVDGLPMKVGVGVADVMCGMYASVGILAALRHRDQTGEGQHIDVALVDTQIAWLINEGVNYLTSGEVPQRRGNGHPNIVPYQVFEASDGHVIVAVGNDGQFRRTCGWLGVPGLAETPDYATNPARCANREALIATLTPLFRARTMATIIKGLESVGVPVGPVNRIDQALASDQVAARGLVVAMARDDVEGGQVRLLGNPLHLSRTPVTYRRPPPRFGQDTADVLGRLPRPEPEN